jgi:hypothetical protein
VHHYDINLVFGDIVALAANHWVGTTMGGRVATVPAVDIFTAGFECDTVSKLNAFSRERAAAACMESGTGTRSSVETVPNRPSKIRCPHSNTMGGTLPCVVVCRLRADRHDTTR